MQIVAGGAFFLVRPPTQSSMSISSFLFFFIAASRNLLRGAEIQFLGVILLYVGMKQWDNRDTLHMAVEHEPFMVLVHVRVAFLDPCRATSFSHHHLLSESFQ